uniref:Uncharacterized protein n=1 Tax=Strigamia maritima TaxID=126957 RepID=T1IIN1_STRMM
MISDRCYSDNEKLFCPENVLVTHLHEQKWLKYVVIDINLCSHILGMGKTRDLNGPDGFQFYWHDLRKESELYSKRVGGGDSVMIWGVFSYDGKSDLAALTGNIKATNYQNMLEEYLLPWRKKKRIRNWTF